MIMFVDSVLNINTKSINCNFVFQTEGMKWKRTEMAKTEIVIGTRTETAKGGVVVGQENVEEEGSYRALNWIVFFFCFIIYINNGYIYNSGY